jgi:hypothetical protein
MIHNAVEFRRVSNANSTPSRIMNQLIMNQPGFSHAAASIPVTRRSAYT